MQNRHLLLAALLLVFAAALLAPAGVAAQGCVTDCPFGENPQSPPTVFISPKDASISGMEAGQTQAVAITWCSSATAPLSSPKVFVNGVEVTGQFSYEAGQPDADCGTRFHSHGAVILVPGANSLKATVVNAYGAGSDFTILSVAVLYLMKCGAFRWASYAALLA